MTFSKDWPHGYRLAGWPDTSEVRLFVSDARGGRPLVGEVRTAPNQEWQTWTWFADGKCMMADYCLINAPRKLSCWLVLAQNDHGEMRHVVRSNESDGREEAAYWRMQGYTVHGPELIEREVQS